MKAAVIGYGNVGMAVFRALLQMREIHELALVGRNEGKIKGELADYLDSMAINTEIKTKISGGGYEKTAGADVIVYTAGPSVKTFTQSRMEIVEDNLAVARQVSEELSKYNRDATIIAISNPVDVLVSALAKYTGRPREKVIGTGTLLDSARLRRQIADIFGIAPGNVDAYVLGEHGNSSCIIWSSLRILGMSMDEFLSAELDDQMKVGRETLLALNRRAGYKILEGKGHTSFGVAAAAAQIVSAIIHDTHEILPVSVAVDGEYGIAPGVALSVPCHVSAKGASVIRSMKLTEEEAAALKASAEIIREVTGLI